ncbi:MAG TPA: ATP-dependent DNA ligase [Isosphaeraceae bacterium]
MRAFAALYLALDATTKVNEKVAALRRYFAAAQPADAAWAVYFLIGRRPRQVVPNKRLRAWAAEEAGIPEWLFDECHDAVGDLAETVALLLPPPDRGSDLPLHHWVEHLLLPVRDRGEAEQRRAVLDAWRGLDGPQRLVWNKLIGGSFRVGISQPLVTRALAESCGVEPAVVAHRLMGAWEPSAAFYDRLRAADARDADSSRPYPFCLAHALDGPPEALGDPAAWLAEWKWDGIRAQLIRRGGSTFLWSRGEELITERYPEIAALGQELPDGTVLDGEILAWRGDAPLPFAQLQRRIGRKRPGRALLAEIPVALVAFDLLEHRGADVRPLALRDRRARLEELIGAQGWAGSLIASPIVPAGDWAGRAAARRAGRDRGAEGLMLKRLDSPYGVGRRRGDWWKWKADPHGVDAVLTAAQRGHGQRAGLYTDYTFSVWDGGRLVPIAKAYSGLTDAEIRQVDAFVRRNLVEKFGPVRTVRPELVFELAFESVQRSPRHKSGLAVRFLRIVRWRHDKTAAEADSLDALRALLPIS